MRLERAIPAEGEPGATSSGGAGEGGCHLGLAEYVYACWQSPLEGRSRARPADEEGPHEMNQKGGLQLPACVQPWRPIRFGIRLIPP
jgi:hypothetical protein